MKKLREFVSPSGEMISKEDRTSTYNLEFNQNSRYVYAPPEGYIVLPEYILQLSTNSLASYYVGGNSKWRIVYANPLAEKNIRFALKKDIYHLWESGKSVANYSSSEKDYYILAKELPVVSHFEYEKIKKFLQKLDNYIAGNIELLQKGMNPDSMPLFSLQKAEETLEELKKKINSFSQWPMIIWENRYSNSRGREVTSGWEIIIHIYLICGGEPKVIKHELSSTSSRFIFKFFKEGKAQELKREWRARVITDIRNRIGYELFYQLDETPYQAWEETEKWIVDLLKKYDVTPQDNGQYSPYRRIFRKGGYFWQFMKHIVPRHRFTRKIYRDIKKEVNSMITPIDIFEEFIKYENILTEKAVKTEIMTEIMQEGKTIKVINLPQTNIFSINYFGYTVA